MDPEELRKAYQRVWMNRYLNRPQSDLVAARKKFVEAILEIDDLERMWALPEAEEP